MKPIKAVEALTMTSIVSEPLVLAPWQDEIQYKYSKQWDIWLAELFQHRSCVGFLYALETILIGCAYIYTCQTHSHCHTV